MTLTEFTEKIAAFENFEKLQGLEIKLKYPHLNFNLTLKGVVAIYEFILKQIEGFDKTKTLPPQLEEVKKMFVRTKGNLLELIKQKNSNEHTWQANLKSLIDNSPPIFLSDSPETEFLIRLNQEQPKYFTGAYEYLTGSSQHATNHQYLTGYLLAYEFTSKDLSLLTERKEAEKKSISSSRADFHKKVGEAQVHLTEYLEKTNKSFTDYSSKIDDLKNQKELAYNTWFDKTSKEFAKFHTDSNKQIKELEDLYKAKLKLEAPAKYWSDRAKKLRKEGYWWLAALVACIIIACLILIWVLNKTADGTLQKIFSETTTAIKWSLVLITLISFLAYGIRIFSKLTFSSFHLVRDAEEREQLTYVYLALQKEKGIDQTERHLIMQSLFSRADSGLLKDDSGPTMPGHIIDQVTKR